MKIAVLSLNPCMDRTLYLSKKLTVGGNHRALDVVENAAGKGLNQAVVLENLGTLCDYYSFSSPSADDTMSRFICSRAFRYHPTVAQCGIRCNVKVIDADGTGTEINEAGGPVSEAEGQAILDDLAAFEGEIVSVCGSVPRGMEKSVYREVIAKAKALGKITVLDADGEALKMGLEAHPDYIKPNRRELAELVGLTERDLATDEAVMCAARQVYERYGTNVLCTMDADGSMYVGDEGVVRAGVAAVEMKGFSGAGDTYLAAFLQARYAWGMKIEDCLEFAARASGAKIALGGSVLPTREQINAIERVEVSKIF